MFEGICFRLGSIITVHVVPNGGGQPPVVSIAVVAANQGAKDRGRQPLQIASSRPICTNCRDAIVGNGGTILPNRMGDPQIGDTAGGFGAGADGTAGSCFGCGCCRALSNVWGRTSWAGVSTDVRFAGQQYDA